MAVSFTKPARSIPDQLILLQQRGLVIRDAAIASHYLTHIGYYRLAGYWKIFQTNVTAHSFERGTRFEAVIEQYDFDREMRLLKIPQRFRGCIGISKRLGIRGPLEIKDVYDNSLFITSVGTLAIFFTE